MTRLGHLGRRIRQSAYPRLRRVAGRLGYDLVRGNYYSPVPDIEKLPERLWSDPPPMPGVDLALEPSLRFVQRFLRPFILEYAPPDEGPGTAHGYFRRNGLYPEVDGEILYSMVRHLAPRRIVEIGAGFSSLVISDALSRNNSDGLGSSERRVFDPYPSTVLAGAGVEAHVVRAEDIPDTVFAELESGDLLMIDTTHTVKAGGDVIRLVLGVLPALNSGVVVHIHDFFRPYEYPRWFFAEQGFCWQEQYLVQAFLALNPSYEVLVANHALARAYPAEVAALIPRLTVNAAGSALWLRRTSDTGRRCRTCP